MPDVAQLSTVPASKFNRVQELRGLEPSRTNQQIVIRFDNIRLAIFADNTDAVGPNTMDRSSLKRHVRQGKSRIVIVGNDDSLATGIVLRGQLLPQIRAVCELRLHQFFVLASELFCERVVAVYDGVVEGFAEVHHCRATAPADRWDVFVDAAPEGGYWGVAAGDDPIGGALEDGDAFGYFGDFGGDLGGGATLMGLE